MSVAIRHGSDKIVRLEREAWPRFERVRTIDG
jgi:hypothetical protein